MVALRRLKMKAVLNTRCSLLVSEGGHYRPKWEQEYSHSLRGYASGVVFVLVAFFLPVYTGSMRGSHS
jgi:hypothetical protein